MCVAILNKFLSISLQFSTNSTVGRWIIQMQKGWTSSIVTKFEPNVKTFLLFTTKSTTYTSPEQVLWWLYIHDAVHWGDVCFVVCAGSDKIPYVLPCFGHVAAALVECKSSLNSTGVLPATNQLTQPRNFEDTPPTPCIHSSIAYIPIISPSSWQELGKQPSQCYQLFLQPGQPART